MLQRKAGDSREGAGVPSIVSDVLRRPGQPLSQDAREFFEPRFGQQLVNSPLREPANNISHSRLRVSEPFDSSEQEADNVASQVMSVPVDANGNRADFSHVKIHTDQEAANSARAVGAHAYTVGNNIVFDSGRYDTRSFAGRLLLSHELTHTVQQDRTSLFRQAATPPACARTFGRAANFTQYIALVREAVTRLQASGYTSVEDRIHVLRGIYYGTTWSADYQVEHSGVRNTGFQVYTASTMPDDPRQILNCGLFEALRASRDVTAGTRQVDVGHLMIGLDARRSWTARNVNIPTQGGTGLEISTWLGDLGGGAGMLAVNRVTAPSTRAVTKFRGSDFGGSSNLEGDIAGYLTARDPSSLGLMIPAGGTIADALQDYLSPATPGTAWNSRCTTFLQAMGGTFDSSNNLSNRATIISSFAQKIEDFACWYLVNRLRQSHRLTLPTLQAASNHVVGASQEMATVFVDALDYCHHHPGSRLEARGAGPSPTSVGSTMPTACSLAINAMQVQQQAAREAERLYQQGRELIREYWPF